MSNPLDAQTLADLRDKALATTPGKEILLSKGFLSLVSDADFALVSRYKWNAQTRSTGNTTYARGRINGKSILLHRFILGLTNPAQVVDHINGNGLDNRRENLRICTQADNIRATKRIKNTAVYIGVYLDKRDNRWQAQIYFNKQRYNLGRFATAIEAGRAYDEKARELHGEFAKQNFPDDKETP